MPKRKSSKNTERDVELPPTTGALGTEKLHRKKRKHQDGGENASGGVGKSSSDRTPIQNAPIASNVLPAYSETPKPPSENLAGAPELQLRGWRGAKEVKQDFVRPHVNSNVNAESCIHFVLHTGAYQWVHVNTKSISAVMLTANKNANYKIDAVYAADHAEAGQADLYNRVEWPTSSRGLPTQMLDPDIGARGFFNRIDVIINDQLVPTNGCLGTLFPHYSRFQAIFAKENPKKSKPHFLELSEWDYDAKKLAKGIMKAATDPFAMQDFKSDDGRRVYVPLDGLFPFDTKSSIHQAIENTLPPKLYLGPSTKLEVKLYFMPTRTETLFHSTVGRDNYYDLAVNVAKPAETRLTLQSAVMEFLSVELFPKIHTDLMARFRGNKMGYWDFDIPRGQHQPLVSGVSYTENTFQIFPYCRTIIVAFLPDHATFYQAHTRRPLSGWSTFPQGCTKIQAEYAGTTLGGPFVKFGIRGTSNELSMSQYYDYLTDLGLAENFSFENLFPDSPTKRSLIQYLVFDVRHLMLDKVQLLRLGMEFASETVSPASHQIAVISIHPNGRANVKNLSETGVDWEMTFLQSN